MISVVYGSECGGCGEVDVVDVMLKCIVWHHAMQMVWCSNSNVLRVVVL